MRVMVACEFTGKVRDAFAIRGHDAWSCDLLDSISDRKGNHIKGNIRDVDLSRFDLMVAHPPCTHLATSGAAHFFWKKYLQPASIALVKFLLNAPVDKIAIENPKGVISRLIRPPDQSIHPYYFGDPYQKTTHLWLKNLPKLIPTEMLEKPNPISVDRNGQKRHWTDAFGGGDGQRRSVTFDGIASAMADQWGNKQFKRLKPILSR